MAFSEGRWERLDEVPGYLTTDERTVILMAPSKGLAWVRSTSIACLIGAIWEELSPLKDRVCAQHQRQAKH